MLTDSIREMVRQIEGALREAERREREAWKRGDVESYHAYQVQVTNLKHKLAEAKKGSYGGKKQARG